MRHKTLHNLGASLVGLMLWPLLWLPLQATAQEPATLGDARTWFTVQGVAATWRSQWRSDGVLGSHSGPALQAESELGVQRRKLLPGLAFGRRIGQRWRIEIERSDSQRSGSTLLSQALKVDGTTFAAGTRLDSSFELKVLTVNGGWSPLLTDSDEVTLLLGGEWITTERRLQGTQQIQGAPGQPPLASFAVSTNTGDAAPVPLLGVVGQHALNDGWRVQGRATLGKGGSFQLTAGGQWQPLRFMVLGLGYRVTRYKLDEVFTVVGCCASLSLNATIHGPMATASLAF